MTGFFESVTIKINSEAKRSTEEVVDTNRKVLAYPERETAILSFLSETGLATTEEICERTGVSPATVRRDLVRMNREGLILRSRGFIQPAPQEEEPAPSPVAQRLAVSNDIDAEKAQIARFAASFVKESDCIFIGAGKTCNLFASYIKNISHLTVVTTNITVVLELIESPNISLVLLGGDVHAGANFIETIAPDSDVEQDLGTLYFDKAFITVDGIEMDSGYTIKNRLQIPLYSRLIQSSRDFYVCADSYKFDRHAFVPVFTLEQVSNIITTARTPQVYRDYYQAHGKKLYLA